MDKDRLKAEALRFSAENMGYIHCEMQYERKPELILAGDYISLMYMTSGIIKRLSEITNQTCQLPRT